MARYSGKIGYIYDAESFPGSGIWNQQVIEEFNYHGDSYEATSRWQTGESINDNIVMSMQISIIADEYAINNFQHIKYAEYMGQLWKVTSIKPQRPRLILTIGELYHGDSPEVDIY